jgi:branched-chain amino acid transport system ATP-binding protein
VSLLRLEGVTRRFGGLTAVDAVSLEIEPGRVSAIIGPNGAGKTTLFNVISGFLAPSEGRVVFGGHDLTGVPTHRVAALGLVRTFQLVQLFPELTAAENVQVGRHLRTRGGVWAALARPSWARRQAAETRAKATELLGFVGLAGREHVPATALPYGQQRLLEIARAMAAEPKLLLLDEPAAGLNPAETDHLAETIRRIVARGITVLLIEHDVSLVMRLAERIFVLDFGRKIAEGPPAAVQQDEAVIAAYLGGTEAEPAAESADA